VRGIERHAIDAEWEETGYVSLARRPHQLEGLAQAARPSARYPASGHGSSTTRPRQEIVRSPVVIGGLKMTGGSALIHPAKRRGGSARPRSRSAPGSTRAPRCARIDDEDGELMLRTDGGVVRARRVVPRDERLPSARAGDPSVDRARLRPCADDRAALREQREAIGWRGREGLGDAANQFHYFRLSADDRILWGGYDATYHYGSQIRPEHEQDDRVHRRLAGQLLRDVPQLEGTPVQRTGGAG